ncbi:sensor histidine kinase [Paraflavitalea sp. CAU 1676]|uniref:sensor histidine kinase n=1 Tax=Paraflavitalea sp. CAU 1676 TaxID=3032598 RepID=UPI0023DAE504|nr:sensor histidine kinase [Paraflavitalea sp. CAU 1676]MDF2189168.1 sensor histidine kinase [Paraflavitalea sp. CAU 1676]
MKRWIDRIYSLLKRHSAPLLFLGLYSWVVINQMEEIQRATWVIYLRNMLGLVVLLLPVLYFEWHKTNWKQRWPARKYWLCWLVLFGLYLPFWLYGWSMITQPGWWLTREIMLSAMFSIILELVLVINDFLQQSGRQWKWVQRLSLERSILLCIVLVSVILSVMAVSSMNDPRYDYDNRLLLGFEFNASKVITHIHVFLAYFLQFLFLYACGYFFFFLNNRILVPVILKQQGVVLYCLTGLAIVGVLYPVIGQMLAWLPLNKRLGYIFSENPFRFENGFGAVMVLLVSWPVVMALQWSRQNQTITALEKEKAEAELDLLHQQLNPHFFFNTLNNLYALSLSQAKETPDTILRLSELMRYTIYKAKEPVVALSDEVKYLEDYIDLQQMRLKRTPDIRFEQSIQAQAPPVAPLLFIVLVENAFKHGIEPAAERAFLHLSLKVKGDRLQFVCVNSLEPADQPVAGIGLKNLQRRLQLLYPGKHRLITVQENHTFKAELELDLS